MHDASSKGSINYLNLAREILQRNQMTQMTDEEKIVLFQLTLPYGVSTLGRGLGALLPAHLPQQRVIHNPKTRPPSLAPWPATFAR